MEWQPMETAPKDGTTILISNALDVYVGAWLYSHWNSEKRVFNCDWVDLIFSDDEGVAVITQPLAWMPLPDPVTKASEAK